MTHWVKGLFSQVWISSKRFTLCYGCLSFILGLVYHFILRLRDFPGNQNHFFTTQNDTRDGVFSLLAVEIIRFLRKILEKCVLWWTVYNNLGHPGNTPDTAGNIDHVQINISIDFLSSFDHLLSNQSCSPGCFKALEQLFSSNAYE